MGNEFSQTLKIPELIQDNLLSFLSVCDVTKLMEADNRLKDQISGNRPFWIQQAKRLYECDPTLYSLFKDPYVYDDQLVYHVIRAGEHYADTKEAILKGPPDEFSIPMPDLIHHLAVDEFEDVIAVVMTTEIRIFSIQRFGDPPLRTFPTDRINEIIIQGNMIITRPPCNAEAHHADIRNWKVDIRTASLGPALVKPRDYPLKKSRKFLLAYDKKAHAAVAYPFLEDGFISKPTLFHYPRNTKMIDYAMKDGDILAIISDHNSHCFFRYSIAKGVTIKSFLVATPAHFHVPTIAFPFVLVTQSPLPSRPPRVYMDDVVFDVRVHIYGARIHIPGADWRALVESRFIGDKMIQVPSIGQFCFIRDRTSLDVLVIYVGSYDAPFRYIDVAARSNGMPEVVSAGLSYFFSRGMQLVRRRFSGDFNIVMK